MFESAGNVQLPSQKLLLSFTCLEGQSIDRLYRHFFPLAASITELAQFKLVMMIGQLQIPYRGQVDTFEDAGGCPAAYRRIYLILARSALDDFP